jgi:microsomal dipeptidase-like Zn-dependent dipeptidase
LSVRRSIRSRTTFPRRKRRGHHVGIGSDIRASRRCPTASTRAGLPASARLLERGMSEGDVEKVLGGNFMRVFEAVEKR